MSYECHCDFDPPEWISVRRVKATRKPFQCSECCRHVPAGEPYEDTWGKWGGFISRYQTCHLCVDLREWAIVSVPCFCWLYTNMLEDVRDMVQEVARDVPGFFFEYGRRMVRIKNAKAPNGRNSRSPSRG